MHLSGACKVGGAGSPTVSVVSSQFHQNVEAQRGCSYKTEQDFRLNSFPKACSRVSAGGPTTGKPLLH